MDFQSIVVDSDSYFFLPGGAGTKQSGR